MGRKPSAKVLDYPTSIRMPLTLKQSLQDAAIEQRRTLSWLIVDILQQWEAFNKTQKKHKNKA